MDSLSTIYPTIPFNGEDLLTKALMTYNQTVASSSKNSPIGEQLIAPGYFRGPPRHLFERIRQVVLPRIRRFLWKTGDLLPPLLGRHLIALAHRLTPYIQRSYHRYMASIFQGRYLLETYNCLVPSSFSRLQSIPKQALAVRCAFTDAFHQDCSSTYYGFPNEIDSRKGVCKGISLSFLYILMSLKSRLPPSHPLSDKMILTVANEFKCGATEQARLLQDLGNWSHNESLFSLKLCAKTEFNSHESIDGIFSLPGTVFLVQGEGTFQGHAVAMIKLSDQDYYIFDANVGLLKLDPVLIKYYLQTELPKIVGSSNLHILEYAWDPSLQNVCQVYLNT